MKFTSVLFALLLISTIPIVSSTGYQVPTISGPQSTLVLPVFFADVGNSTSIQTVQSRVFDDLSAYLQNVSYGNVSITGRVAPKWYKLPYSMSYYGSGFDKLNELIAHSVRAADPDVNYREYAYLIIVHAGDDSDRSGKPNDVKSSASLGAYGPLYTGEGTVALSVSIVAEKDPLGVYAHWFLRSSGLTELWHYGIYESVPEDDFMGEWCVMAHGFWGNNGSTPVHPCSWSKMKLGWIPPSQVLDVPSNMTVNAKIDPLEAGSKNVHVVKVPVTASTYYLIEVRQKIGFDASLPSNGVLITYVDEWKKEGQGRVRVVDANSGTATLNDAAFKVGGMYENRDHRVTVFILAQSGSSFEVRVDRSGRPAQVTLTVETPYPRLSVKVDGVQYDTDSEGRVVSRVFPGEHLVGIQKEYSVTKMSRAIFEGWADGDTSNPRRVSMEDSRKLSARYKLQYMLDVQSLYSNSEGSGWYDVNSTVTFSVPPLVQFNNGTRRVFTQWSGDSNAVEPTASVKMSKPRVIVAEWKTQYMVVFSATGIPDGVTLTLTFGNTHQKLAVPQNYSVWLDDGAEAAFGLEPTSARIGDVTYTFQSWRGNGGVSVSSPIVIHSPQLLEAVYSSSRTSTVVTSKTFLVASTTFPANAASTISSSKYAYGKLILYSHSLTDSFSALPAYIQPFVHPIDWALYLAEQSYMMLGSWPLAALLAWIVAASVSIGLFYVLPVALVLLLLALRAKKAIPRLRLLTPLPAIWVAGVALFLVGEILPAAAGIALVTIGLALTALTTILLTGLCAAIGVAHIVSGSR